MPTSHITRDVQMKETIRCHCTRMRMARILRTSTTPNAAEAVEKHELSRTADGDAKRRRHFGRQYGLFL